MSEDPMVMAVKEYVYSRYKETKKTPTVTEVASEFKVSSYRIIEIFKILVHLGLLKQNVTRYKMGEEVVEPVVVKAEENNNSMSDISPVLVNILRVVLAVIAVGAVCMSVYYTSNWLLDYLPPFLAIVLSSIMVTFSCMAFEIIILLKKNRQYLMMSMFVVLWVIVIFFSMASTIAGQYNQRIRNDTAKIESGSDVTQLRMEYDIYLDQEARINKQIEDKTASRATYQKILDGFDTIEKRKKDKPIFDDVTSRIVAADKEIIRLQLELAKVQDKKLEYLGKTTGAGAVKETVVEIPSFYGWINSIFPNLSPVMIEFWMGVFPAIFIDLIAPFSLAISLFVRRAGTSVAKPKSKKLQALRESLKSFLSGAFVKDKEEGK
jgi:hypothetical protein